MPASVPALAPAILLLHGSGHDGRLLVEKWQKLADREGIILVGPDARDPMSWNSKYDTPVVFRDIVNDVNRKHAIDEHRVYLFGHSAGASFGIILALAESRYFAAAAVHAGALHEREYRIAQFAERKIPIAIWSGTLDRSVPITAVEATAAELKRKEFPLTLTVMPGHDHNYYIMSDEVNRAAWAFLREVRNDDPRFTEYDYQK